MDPFHTQAAMRYFCIKKALANISQVLDFTSAEGQNRTADTGIFSPLLYRLSYLGTTKIRLEYLFDDRWFVKIFFPQVAEHKLQQTRCRHGGGVGSQDTGAQTNGHKAR